MLNRRPTTTHREQIRGELAEGFEHLKSATACAAEGAAQRISPRVDNALVAVGVRKRPRRRWPWIVGAALAGAAAMGAAGVIMLRRNHTEIDEELIAEDFAPSEPTPATDMKDAMAAASM